jgi:transcriptional regulator with XRE-family HTH domain
MSNAHRPESVHNRRTFNDQDVHRIFVARYLRWLRVEAGLLQKEVGRILSMTHAGVSKLESGLVSPRVDQLMSLSAAYNFEVAAFLVTVSHIVSEQWLYPNTPRSTKEVSAWCDRTLMAEVGKQPDLEALWEASLSG